MNKLKNNFILILLFIIIYLLFKYNYIINGAVIYGVNLWLTKVFPSLFIMFILNDIIINTNLLNQYINIINPLFNKIFNTDGYSSYAFILSLFSGTPSSIYIINNLLNNNLISINSANKLITFTYFPNPLFLYNILKLSFNKRITIKIIIIIYISNIIIGILFRNINKPSLLFNNIKINKQNIISIIPKSINKSFNTLLMILGTIIFYMIISNLLITIFKPSLLINVLLKGILEITQSLNILPKLNIISILKEIIAIIIISFGGLSIHTQIISLINDSYIKYKYFFIARLLHILISTCIYICCFTC